MNQNNLKYLIALFIFIATFSYFNNIASANPIHGNKLSFYTSEREVNLKLTYKISITGHVNIMDLKMVVPDNIKDRQTVKSISFSIQPDSTYKMNNNTYVLFKFHDLDKSFKIVIKSKITIYRSITEAKETVAEDLSEYLIAEKDIESDNKKILDVAATLKQKTDIETVIKTFDYVTNTIKYEANQAIGAEKVLETKVGKCMDYSDLFVALLRANRIPAKSVFGIVVDYDGDNPLHAWPEAYLKKQGWIRFDPTTGHSDITQTGKDYKMKISNKYIILSEGRNDPELNTNQYQCKYRCTLGSKMDIGLSFDIAAQDNESNTGGID